MSAIPFHPLAELFPLLAGAELEALAQDIGASGLRHPITLLDGKILDGRNRYLACLKVGIEPRFQSLTEFDGPSPLAFVVSENLRRRHLSESQRGMVAAKLANLKQGRPEKQTGKFAAFDPVTQEEAAKLLNVSERTVRDAKAVLRDAPDEVPAIEAGQKTICQVARRLKQAELSGRTPAAPTGRYRILYADPPWKYGSMFETSDALSGLAAENNYPTMSIAELCALPIAEIAEDNAVLFLWVTAPLLGECWPVIEAWGFRYRSGYVWDKQRGCPGNYSHVRHEHLLVCARGSCVPDVAVTEPSVQVIKRTGKHSEKPEEFRQLIDRLYPNGKRIELFRRGEAPAGWEAWGNEAQSKVASAEIDQETAKIASGTLAQSLVVKAAAKRPPKQPKPTAQKRPIVLEAAWLDQPANGGLHQ